MMRPPFLLTLALLAALATPCASARANEVNVYSQRQISLVDPLFQAFEAETGIAVNILYASKGLVERIALEGSASPADILLASDIGQLLTAAASIAQPVDSFALTENIPAAMRDPENYWFGLTRRARMIFVSRSRIDEKQARSGRITYEDLATPQWQGKLCMRDAQHPYNISLIAAMITRNGVEPAREWLKGLKANLARRPAGGDRAQMFAVAQGQCDAALANSYYFGVMQAPASPESQKLAAKQLRPVFPVFEGGGTHINISGMVMARHAPNPENAKTLMEWLSSKTAQNLFAAGSFEYPVNRDANNPPGLPAASRLRPDNTRFADILRNRAQASLLVDQTGLNQ